MDNNGELIQKINWFLNKPKNQSQPEKPLQYGNKIYLRPGEKAPEGVTIKTGPQGGKYYEIGSISSGGKPRDFEKAKFIDASDLEGLGCPHCGTKGKKNFKIGNPIKNREGEVTFWENSRCNHCGGKVSIAND